MTKRQYRRKIHQYDITDENGGIFVCRGHNMAQVWLAIREGRIACTGRMYCIIIKRRW